MGHCMSDRQAVSVVRRDQFLTWAGLVLLPLWLILVGACGTPQPMRVVLVADGKEQPLVVTAEQMTIRDLLSHVGVTLSPLDRVDPDLYVLVSAGMKVNVTRVKEEFETEQQALPFAHQTVRSERVPLGERRLLQTGSNGELEITYRVVFDDGIQVAREEVRREVQVKPVDEIMVVGIQEELTSVPISGTIVYLSGGNAWLMRESSDLRRNITGSGDLDGRVFDLSQDGAGLLFTRAATGDENGPLNSLWMAQPSLVGEEPQSLGITGVIWAAWAPDGRQFAYSTAERVAGVPGWKANDDLWLATLADEPAAQVKAVKLLPATAEIPYAWWGRVYAWSPDGNYLAYAQSNEVGIITLVDGVLVPLVSFPTFQTRSAWAWVPSVSWSSDGYLLAFVGHRGDVEGLSPEDSPVFDLLAVSVNGELQVPLVEEVGMWSGPRWSPTASGMLVYGQAQSPRNSQDSRYELFLIDRDGSNARRIFPVTGLMGLVAPDVAWSPDGDAVLIEYEGNLYRVDVETNRLNQLTTDGQSSHPRWGR